MRCTMRQKNRQKGLFELNKMLIIETHSIELENNAASIIKKLGDYYE